MGRDAERPLMTSLTPNDTQSADSRIFGLLLTGELTEGSSIADAGETVLLSEHPRYSKLLQLIRMGRSTRVLTDAASLANRAPSWEADLAQTYVGETLFQIQQQRATGFSIAVTPKTTKVLAFSSGVTVNASSNDAREQLGALMLRQRVITRDQAQQAAKVGREARKPIGWALIRLGFVDADALIEILEAQARERLLNLFQPDQGMLRFYADERAHQLTPVVNLPLLEVFRRGLTWRRTLSADDLETLTDPILSQSVPLSLNVELGTLEFACSAGEGVLLKAARAGELASAFRQRLRHGDPHRHEEVLRGVYTFARIGVLGLKGEAAPPLRQPWGMSSGEQRPEDLFDFAEGVEADAQAPNASASLTEPALVHEGETAASAVTEPNSPLQNYRAMQRQEQDAKRLLNAGRYIEARDRFEDLLDRHPKPAEIAAYLSLSTLFTRGVGAKTKAHQLAQRAVSDNGENAVAHVALSRALEALNQPAPAKAAAKRALSLSENSSSYLTEVQALLDAARGSEHERLPSRRPTVPMVVGAGTWVVPAGLLVLLFAASNVVGLGAREYLYTPTDPFFFLRRLLLMAVGFWGLQRILATPPRATLEAMGWHLPWTHLGIAVGVGVAVGYVSPLQRVVSPAGVVIAMTVFHVVAEEVFFRGFITRYCMERFDNLRLVVLVSAGVFGAYHLTYYSFWIESDLVPRLYWIAAVTLVAGVPLAWLYAKTRSLVPPLVAHMLINQIMMARSLWS